MNGPLVHQEKPTMADATHPKLLLFRRGMYLAFCIRQPIKDVQNGIHTSTFIDASHSACFPGLLQNVLASLFQLSLDTLEHSAHLYWRP